MENQNNPPSVLIIEDDNFLRNLVVKKLQSNGFSVLQASDGKEGLNILKQNKPDIILLDLILPGLDGFETLQLIKTDPETKAIPVIVLSNLGQDKDVERAKQIGAIDYLVKAYTDLNEIVSKVFKVVTK